MSTIIVKSTGEEIKTEEIICIENGAYAIYPADQGSANIGWVLLDDPDNYEFDSEEADDRLCDEFMSDDGENCWEGDSDFNLYIEQLYIAKHPK